MEDYLKHAIELVKAQASVRIMSEDEMADTHRDKAMVLSNYALGTVDYHVIGTNEQKDLLSLIDSQLVRWANDGTLRSWYEAYDLLYDLG